MKLENELSRLAMIWLTSLVIRMKTSLDGSFFGMWASRYALPMSIVVTSLPSAAAICASRKMEVVLTVGEEVSAALYCDLS